MLTNVTATSTNQLLLILDGHARCWASCKVLGMLKINLLVINNAAMSLNNITFNLTILIIRIELVTKLQMVVMQQMVNVYTVNSAATVVPTCYVVFT